MSVGHFAIGAREDFKPLARAVRSGAKVDGVELQGMGLIDLVTLANLVWPDAESVDVLRDVARVSGGAALLLPDSFRDALAGLGDSTGGIAERWAQSEEFRGLMEPAELGAFLQSLRGLCAEAAGSGKQVVFVNV